MHNSTIAYYKVPDSPNSVHTIVISSHELAAIIDEYDVIKSDIIHELLHYIEFKDAVREKRIWWDINGWHKKRNDRTTFSHLGNWKSMADRVSRMTGIDVSRTGSGTKTFQDNKNQKVKYSLICTQCGTTCATYATLSPTVKKYMRGESPYICSVCRGKLKLVEN